MNSYEYLQSAPSPVNLHQAKYSTLYQDQLDQYTWKCLIFSFSAVLSDFWKAAINFCVIVTV